MPLSLFAVRNFTVGNISAVLVYGALSIPGFIIAVSYSRLPDTQQ
jgi:hypothetical protein